MSKSEIAVKVYQKAFVTALDEFYLGEPALVAKALEELRKKYNAGQLDFYDIVEQATYDAQEHIRRAKEELVSNSDSYAESFGRYYESVEDTLNEN